MLILLLFLSPKFKREFVHPEKLFHFFGGIFINFKKHVFGVFRAKITLPLCFTRYPRTFNTFTIFPGFSSLTYTSISISAVFRDAPKKLTAMPTPTNTYFT